MIDRLSLDTPVIIIADRGYEGYNLFTHLIKSGQNFIIRLKDDDSNGIISTYEFPYESNGEFDCDIETTLTWKQTNYVKENRQIYTYVSSDRFDFYEDGNPYFPLELRILCVEIAPGQFEYLATNLDRNEFQPAAIKELYHLRWGQEGSFRDLKYTIDLVHFHCKKRD
jgi:IS4 transposase